MLHRLMNDGKGFNYTLNKSGGQKLYKSEGQKLSSPDNLHNYIYFEYHANNIDSLIALTSHISITDFINNELRCDIPRLIILLSFAYHNKLGISTLTQTQSRPMAPAP